MEEKLKYRLLFVSEMARLCRLLQINSEVFCDRYGNEVDLVRKKIPVTAVTMSDGFVMECSEVRMRKGEISFHEYGSSGEFSDTDYVEFTKESIEEILNLLKGMWR